MFKCDNCGSSDTYVKNYKHEYNIKGEKVIFEKERRFCRKCNKLVFDAYLDNEASKEALLLPVCNKSSSLKAVLLLFLISVIKVS